MTVTWLEKHSNFAVALFCPVHLFSQLSHTTARILPLPPLLPFGVSIALFLPSVPPRQSIHCATARANHPPRKFQQPLAATTRSGSWTKKNRECLIVRFTDTTDLHFCARPRCFNRSHYALHVPRARDASAQRARNREMLTVVLHVDVVFDNAGGSRFVPTTRYRDGHRGSPLRLRSRR